MSVRGDLAARIAVYIHTSGFNPNEAHARVPQPRHPRPSAGRTDWPEEHLPGQLSLAWSGARYGSAGCRRSWTGETKADLNSPAYVSRWSELRPVS